MPKNYKKTNPRLLNIDVYNYIAENSSLTIEQVKECFKVYCNFVKALSCNIHRPKELTIPLPNLGHFYYLVVKGRKKGSTYKIPKQFGKDTSDKEIITITLEEDEPNFDKIRFKVSPTLLNELKESSKRNE